MTDEIASGPSPYHYWAFISYSHKDDAQAKWLHRAIETYGIPAKLMEHGHTTPMGEPVPKRFHPIFRDSDELPAASDLGEAIVDALRASRYLIVVCSPHAAPSKWVNREIEVFTELGRNDRVFAYIVDGEPNSGTERECFPPTLRQQEPLAADARQQGDGRGDAKLKLLAGMLGVSFDALKQRDSQRRIRRLEVVAAVALVLILVFGALAWYADRQRAEADLARKEAVAAKATAFADRDARATAQFVAEEQRQQAVAAKATAVTEAQVRGTAQAQAQAAEVTAVAEAHTRATAQAVAEEERQIAVARQLAAQAQLALDDTGTGLVRSALLSVESLRRYASLEGDQAIRKGLALLPRPVSEMVHEGSVTVTAFSPDGKWVASGSSDLTVRVWESSTGTEVARLIHDGGVTALAFSPDGKRIVSGGGHDACVWEPGTGKEIMRIVHHGNVTVLAFSGDGKRILSGADDGVVSVWDAVTGQEIAEVVHDEPVHAAAFSPDGRWVASGSGRIGSSDSPGEMRVWDASTGEQVVSHADVGPVSSLAFSPDGIWIASASGDHTVRVWEAASGKAVPPMDHLSQVTAIAFSPNSKWVASASLDSTARIWEAATGKELARMPHAWSVQVVAFSPDGNLVVTGSADNTTRVWEARTGKEQARMVGSDREVTPYTSYAINAVVFSPDGKWISTGSSDKSSQVWETANAHEIRTLAHHGRVIDAVFSPDGRWVAAAGGEASSHQGEVQAMEVSSGRETIHRLTEQPIYDVSFSPDSRRLAVPDTAQDTVRLFELATGIEIEGFPHRSALTAAFSPCGHWIATGGSDGTVQVWDAETHNKVANMTHGSIVGFVAFAQDGRLVISGPSDWSRDAEGQEVKVWEVATGRMVAHMPHAKTVTSLAVSPNGMLLATAGGWDEAAHLWEVSTGREVSTLHHESYVSCVAFSPDGKYLASGGGSGGDFTARVWEVATGGEIARTAHWNGIESLAFSPDGKWVASGGWDAAVRIWEASTGREAARFLHGGELPWGRVYEVYSVAFSPNGRRIVSGSYDRTARVWLWRPEDLIAETCARVHRNLTTREWQQYFGDEPCRAICSNLPDMCSETTPTPGSQ